MRNTGAASPRQISWGNPFRAAQVAIPAGHANPAVGTTKSSTIQVDGTKTAVVAEGNGIFDIDDQRSGRMPDAE